jgi:hypothetical protein
MSIHSRKRELEALLNCTISRYQARPPLRKFTYASPPPFRFLAHTLGMIWSGGGGALLRPNLNS